MEIITVDQAAEQLDSLVERTAADEVVQIVRGGGSPAAVLLNASTYDELLKGPHLVSMRRAVKELNSLGRGRDLHTAMAEVQAQLDRNWTEDPDPGFLWPDRRGVRTTGLPVIMPPEVDDQLGEVLWAIGWAGNSVKDALAWAVRLRDALDALGDFHGHAVDEDATSYFRQETRSMVFERTGLIHYQVRPAAVWIIGVRQAPWFPHEDKA